MNPSLILKNHLLAPYLIIKKIEWQSILIDLTVI